MGISMYPADAFFVANSYDIYIIKKRAAMRIVFKVKIWNQVVWCWMVQRNICSETYGNIFW